MSEKSKVVVEEKVFKPSTVTPTLFVGLGGCGSEIAVGVHRLLKQDPSYHEKYKDLIKFAVVDTNINDLERYRELADATFLISDFEKAEYSKLASGKLFLEPDTFFTQWVPDNYRFRAGDTAGAGQIRIESRLGCYYQMKHSNFVEKFTKLFDDLRAHDLGHRRIDTRDIRIIICYSTAGGTGSGAHLSMAYFLKDLARMVGKPLTIGVAVQPSVFGDKAGVNKDGIFANGYAALKETEHLMKLGSPESKFFPEDGLTFHYNPSDMSKTKVFDKPFEFLYVIDRPESFTVKDIKKATSAGLYLQFFSSIFKEQAGDYDNYTQHQRFLVPHDFESKGITGFTSFYGSFGAAVLHVPNHSLLKYTSIASAVSILREQYLSDIPSDAVYANIFSNDEEFYQVHGEGDNPADQTKLSEFPDDAVKRRSLKNRLFQKRITLLAQCEYEKYKKSFDGHRFGAIYRHGVPLGVAPISRFGSKPEIDENYKENADKGYTKEKANYSIYQALMDQFGAQEGFPALLEEAIAKMNEYLDQKKPAASTDKQPKSQVLSKVRENRKNAIRDALDILETGGESLYGFTSVLDLNRWFKTHAAETNLMARRFGLLGVLSGLSDPKEMIDSLGEEVAPPEKEEPKKSGGILGFGGGDDLDETEQADLIKKETNAIKNQLSSEIQKEFWTRMITLRSNMEEYLRTSSSREDGIEVILKEKEAEMDRLCEQGDIQTEKYVLDAEAFQMENGRRLWDFYYVDQIQGKIDSLTASSPEIQNIFQNSFENKQSPNEANRSLLKQLENISLREIKSVLLPNPEAEDSSKKDGLTITKALELEIEYRAIYLSNSDEIARDKLRRVRQLVAKYRSNPHEKIDITESIYLDYLQDKVKRISKEKAGLLCSYDSSREGHGGVRPDKVKLIALHKDFSNSFLARVIDGSGENYKMVSEEWTSKQEVVFYNAILNVPLYVFRRMERMRQFYYQFKNMAKRSKVLHVDKNWENSLLDLDPLHAQKEHRRKLVQANIIQFASLLTMSDVVSGSLPYLLRKEGSYYIRNPEFVAEAAASGLDLTSDDWECLGSTMSEAIEILPEILNNRSVRYVKYQQILDAVMKGYTPRIIQQVLKLPFRWRQSYDDLRMQYGDNPTVEQQILLNDFKDSYSLMADALCKMLVDIRNKQKEEETLSSGQDVLDSLLSVDDQHTQNIRISIQLLEGFELKWNELFHPQANRHLDDNFQGIFSAIEKDTMQKFLKQLGNS